MSRVNFDFIVRSIKCFFAGHDVIIDYSVPNELHAKCHRCGRWLR